MVFLVANEVLEEVKKMKGSCVFFKVDYQNAYDLVIWYFVYYMMEFFFISNKLIE